MLQSTKHFYTSPMFLACSIFKIALFWDKSGSNKTVKAPWNLKMARRPKKLHTRCEWPNFISEQLERVWIQKR